MPCQYSGKVTRVLAVRRAGVFVRPDHTDEAASIVHGATAHGAAVLRSGAAGAIRGVLVGFREPRKFATTVAMTRRRDRSGKILPTVTFAEVLGGVLRYRRKQAGMNQAEVAERIGLSTSAWSRIENGQADMTVVQLQIAAPALNADAWELLKLADSLCKKMVFSKILVVERTPDKIGTQWMLGGKSAGNLVAKMLGDA